METSIIKSKKPYILTIDDDPDFNGLLELMLNKLQVSVVITSVPDTFFKTIVESRPRLCLVDINLGQNYGAGFELIKLLRKEKFNDIPIIVVSSMKSKEDIQRAIDLGATDYMTKPIEKVILAEKVRHFIEIDQSAYDPFKLFSVPDRFSSAKIDLDLNLYRVGFDKVSFLSKVYIAPQTIISTNESSFCHFGHKGDNSVQLQVLRNKLLDEGPYSEIICRICQGEREDKLKIDLRKWLFFR